MESRAESIRRLVHDLEREIQDKRESRRKTLENIRELMLGFSDKEQLEIIRAAILFHTTGSNWKGTYTDKKLELFNDLTIILEP